MSHHNRIVVWYVDKEMPSRERILPLFGSKATSASTSHCSAVRNTNTMEELKRDQQKPHQTRKFKQLKLFILQRRFRVIVSKCQSGKDRFDKGPLSFGYETYN